MLFDSDPSVNFLAVLVALESVKVGLPVVRTFLWSISEEFFKLASVCRVEDEETSALFDVIVGNSLLYCATSLSTALVSVDSSVFPALVTWSV